MEPVKVVARFLDGRVVKGYTHDFFPNKPVFHLGKGPSDKGEEVLVKDLKALFFVRDFAGNPKHSRRKTFVEGKVYQGKKAEVKFRDGEMIAGTVLSYDRARPGFFLVPADEEGNNMRAFVVSESVADLRFL